MFFFGCEKEPKSVGDLDFPHTPQNHPWRSGARGQLGLRIKRDFVNWTKPLFFLFLSSWKHKHKTMSSVK